MTGSAYVLPEKVYNPLKFIAQILLPGLGALYFALAGTWNLPDAEQVVGTVTAIDVFLGLLLGLSSAAYNSSEAKYDGHIEVAQDSETGVKTASLMLNNIEDPADIAQKKQVTFKVKKS